jgi:hypothetical protein
MRLHAPVGRRACDEAAGRLVRQARPEGRIEQLLVGGKARHR